MAELHQKRLHEETIEDSDSAPKRQKPPYELILNFLDEDEDDGDPNVDLSAILTSFQQELESLSSDSAASEIPQIRRESEAESVMRHLLEASDDELGIPNDNVEVIDNDMNFGIDENPLWELEDDNSDFSTLQLQQQQFQEEEFLM